jgi:16S rRNA (cytosine967-C5)-methyltransferase
MTRRSRYGPARRAGDFPPGGADASPRLAAARLVFGVVERGQSLSQLLSAEPVGCDDPRQRALTRELAYGSLRWYYRLDAVLRHLLGRPLKIRDRDLHALLLVGLYQVLIMDMPAHAAVSESVDATHALGKGWARGLVNGVLRNALRSRDDLLEKADVEPAARWSHPGWWVERLRRDWPDQWQDILRENNRRPPMTIRVNRLRQPRADYLAGLRARGIEARSVPHADAALELESPVAVDELPGFRDGVVSVQDAGAQLAAPLLRLDSGQRVLDACAAPGGKTGQILELCTGLDELVAIDSDAQRLARVAENLARLQLDATCVHADAADPAGWWDGRPFDRILLDAPCSASGVVRRHPDIKLLRRDADLQTLAVQQRRLLDALWPLLASGGILLYVTCSVFSQENGEVTAAFLERHTDAREIPADVAWGQVRPVGRQLLPGQDGMDGFYFARLVKA